MTLPSPSFSANSLKPALADKSHGKPDFVKVQPSQYVAYCKYCREGFSSENELFQHRKSHERCPYDDCKFNASGKTVAEHVQRVHMKTNSLVKIQDLTTPEQVEKWREERRKRYPTSANVALRQQAQEVRFQRGEKLQDRQQRFGDFQQRNHIKNLDNRTQQKSDWNQKKNQRYQRKDRFVKPERNHQNDEGKEKPETSSAQAKPGLLKEEIVPNSTSRASTTVDSPKPQIIKKILEVPKPLNDDSSDDERRATPSFKGTSQMKNYRQVEEIVKEQAALSILGMYGSDSESEVEEPSQPMKESSKIGMPADDVEMEDQIVPCDDEEQLDKTADDEAPDEVPINHTSDGPAEASSTMTTEKPGRKRRRENQTSRREVKMKPRTVLDYSKLRLKPSVNPFLERLLQDDIRHERNVLLQCVNYVVKRNFFETVDVIKPAEPLEEDQQIVNSESHVTAVESNQEPNEL